VAPRRWNRGRLAPRCGAWWGGRNKKHSPRLDEEAAGAGVEKELEELESGTRASGAEELLEPEDLPLEPELQLEKLEPGMGATGAEETSELEPGVESSGAEETSGLELGGQAERQNAPAAMKKTRDSFTGATYPILPSRTRIRRHGGGNANDGRSATAAAGVSDQHVPSDRTLAILLGAVGTQAEASTKRTGYLRRWGRGLCPRWMDHRPGRISRRCVTRGGGGVGVGCHHDAARSAVRRSHARKASR